jgi:hypothetical protein
VLTDQEIAELLAESKPLPGDAKATLLRLRALKKIRDGRSRLTVRGKTGRKYQIEVLSARSEMEPCKFRINIKYLVPHTRPLYLVRCEGYGAHTNTIERKARTGIQKIPPRQCHIHTITERYQLAGKPLGYAEPTNEYDSLETAVDFVCYSFGFHFTGMKNYPSAHPLFDNPK